MSNVSLVETSCVVTSKQSGCGCYILGAFHPSVRQRVQYLKCISTMTQVAFFISVTQMLTRADRLLYELHVIHLWRNEALSSISFSCLWRKCAMPGLHFFLFGKKMMTQAGCLIWHVFHSSVTQILTGTKAHSCFSGNIFWSFSWRGSGFRIKDQSQNKNTGISYTKY